MGRPPSIPWRERVKIFIDYRGSQVVLSTAKNNGVARSTVTSIVDQFEQLGFTRKARATLPKDVLREMQEKHIENLLLALSGSDDEDPFVNQLGGIDLGPTTRSELETMQTEGKSQFISEEIGWHLKGSDAEQALSVVHTAAADYRHQHRRAWQDLQSDLEAFCMLPELAQLPLVNDMESQARILPSLRDKMHNAFSDSEFKQQLPTYKWLSWDIAEDAPSALRLHHQYVAIGSPRDHANVKNGILKFIDEKFQQYQRRFLELGQLRRDLRLLDQVTKEKRSNINADDIRSAVCPACPYPEANVLPMAK